ncbi:lipocalin-like domain-containing protein [Chitinophaga japonensis]|uniref:Lipocalin-like protein n=1 Tax=Chitinophaga japonensis TaxID=104662 RepID=A0A562TEB5_CHIJA|nr:lipocalin family protein [Chitinophaga japonensis]TWI91604.1 lipocalin-like protein [Chitinophaga japonensis]
MIRHLLVPVLITVFAACSEQPKKPDPVVTEDSSLLQRIDTAAIAPGPDTAFIQADTATWRPEQLIGKWLRPVPGLDKEMQGFQLKKNGSAVSINMYTLVYEKWELVKDTLLLWNHTEGEQQKDSAATIDTTVIKDLTDSTLVLFPVKAAEGYLEEYQKKK